MRRALLVVALLTFPGPVSAQTIDRAAAGVRASSTVSTESSPRPGLVQQESDTARRRAAPYLLVGALAGAVVGYLLEDSFHDDFCTPGPGVTCSSDYDGIGVVIGAGLGALAGWMVYVISEPRTAAASPSMPRFR